MKHIGYIVIGPDGREKSDITRSKEKATGFAALNHLLSRGENVAVTSRGFHEQRTTTKFVPPDLNEEWRKMLKEGFRCVNVYREEPRKDRET